MFFISSERLKLLPLTHSHLQLWAENRHLLDNLLNLAPSSSENDPEINAELEDALQNYWLPKTAEFPQLYQWYTNWDIILLSENRSIGGICLAGYPLETGETMVGYGISKPYQQQGFASEALSCIMQWAFLNPDLKAIIATTPPQHFPSHKVLEKNGFMYQGMLEDNLLWRMERG